MAMTTDQEKWLRAGVRAVDSGSGSVGVVQLLQDELGEVRTEVIERPTRALLRPVDGREPLWWAYVADLERPVRR
jgi:hypothetical protein